MMKKISKLALLATATAFLLAAFPACSDDDDDNNNGTEQGGGSGSGEEENPGGEDLTVTEIKIAVATTVKAEYTVGDDFDPTGITVTAKLSDGSTEDVTAETDFKATTDDGKPFTTETAGTYTVTLTATYGGKTATKTCEITVKASGPESPNTPAATALTGTWTALEFADSTDYKDKLAVSAGTALGKVTVEGTGVNWRGGKQSDTNAYIKWNHLELGKKDAGCLKFEVGAESSVVVEAASTGGSNISDIALCTGTDGTGTVTGDKQTVSGSGYTTVTFDTVPAGTYYLGAFPATTNERGVRIKSITVTAK